MDNQKGKNEVPTPPPSKVSVRTMQSDIKSMKEGGGQNPQPYVTEINQEPKKAVPEEISFQPTEMESNIPGYVGPEEPIFQAGAPIVPLPPKQKAAKAEKNGKPRKKPSKVLIILVIIILAAITTGIGYYFIYKKIKAPTPVVTPPEEIVTPTPIPTPAPQYVSLLKIPSVFQEEKIIPSLILDDIKNNLIGAASTIPANTLKEVILRNQDQTLVSFPQFISVIIPELTSEITSAIFQQNLTVVIFSDENGIWSGHIAQLNPAADIAAAQNTIKQILESSASLTNIFLTETSSTVAVFKDGKAGDPEINTRYLVFPKTGAAVNYGWVGDKLVISASYSGFSEILKKLQ